MLFCLAAMTMNKQRLESFSDATVAIIMTIMVLELDVPNGTDWNALLDVLPVFISYVLSFLICGPFLVQSSPSIFEGYHC
ncbi:TMEM175 family protein [Polluticoccus soli]|uniref:TMEM175 family protein n=1 Tax=Polluticoccus soli TaxID=3034150 RepID=UPI0023E1428F|nr:TMEM175 family protein [Flavipsychrobacter sp. JY13-12]